MKIGELARRTAAKPETIRFYEKAGLLPSPPRTRGNYRDYGEKDFRRLAFIRHARGLGFDLEDIRALLELSDQPQRDCSEVDRITSGHLEVVHAKIAQLECLRSELERMLRQCRGGRVSDCRIIEALSNHDRCEAH